MEAKKGGVVDSRYHPTRAEMEEDVHIDGESGGCGEGVVSR